MFRLVKEVKFLRDLVWIWGAYQYAKKPFVEGQDESSIWRVAAASMYYHGLGAAFSAKRAVETAHRGYATLKEFRTLPRALGNTVQSLDYPSRLPRQSLGEFLDFMFSTRELAMEYLESDWSQVRAVRTPASTEV